MNKMGIRIEIKQKKDKSWCLRVGDASESIIVNNLKCDECLNLIKNEMELAEQKG